MGNSISTFGAATSIENDSVLAMICDSVAEVPHRTAVVADGKSLTFSQLFACAKENAEKLRRSGLMAGDFILCSIDRGITLPIAWITAMLCGGVFVPIDRNWPIDRLRYVAKLTKARFELSHSENEVPLESNLMPILVEANSDATTVDPSEVSLPVAMQAMYGFFTSGSTGKPKCALNHHAGVANRFKYMTRRFGTGNVVLQNSPHLFDSSIWQILWPLCSQGTLVVPSERRPADVEYAVGVIERHGVTMTDFVPSIFSLLVRSISTGKLCADRLGSLRCLIIGGEEMDASAVVTFLKHVSHIKLINTYGHTEASVGMVFHDVTVPVSGSVPLGIPIDNTYVRICDDTFNLCPPGEIGEVVVGGICVGLGYLGQPELTKNAFVDNPFPDIPGYKVYRTGDMGRINGEGLLEYHGRADHQVKLRGVRIELCEIEHAVRSAFDDDIQAVAVTFETNVGDDAIGMVYASSTPRSPEEIHAAAKRCLPASHLPKIALRLDDIPLTQNGKVDRRRISLQLRQAGRVATPIGTTLEDKLVYAFKAYLPDVLVGPDTHFFRSGGDSLDAVNLTLYLEAEFGLMVDLARLYEYSTPVALAACMSTDRSERSSRRSQVLPDYRGDAFPAPPVQPPTHILLTGATGFLGLHVLEAILRSSEARVSVLVRSADHAQAVRRLLAAATEAGIGLRRWLHRLDVLAGDLSEPRLGCSEETWRRLEREVAAVFHAGAEVNFLLPYAQLHAANVQSTHELVRLCASGRSKRLHYASSLAACKYDSLRPYDDQCEPTLAELNGVAADGYGTSKVASERLVRMAARSGLASTIYRLDDVLPSLVTGFANKRSLIYRFFNLCHRHRIAPTNVGGMSALTVDEAAAHFSSAVCAMPRVPVEMGRACVEKVKSASAVEIARVFRAVERVSRRTLRYLDYAEFIERLMGSDDSHARLVVSMLPAPAEQNDIFGAAIDDANEVWDGDYFTLATALIDGTKFHVKSKELEDGKHA